MLTHAGIHLDRVTYAVYMCHLCNRKYRSAASVRKGLVFLFFLKYSTLAVFIKYTAIQSLTVLKQG